MTLPRSTLEHAGGRIELLEAEVYVVPTERPESDGTFAWDRTTVIVVRAHGGGCSGIGWTFAHASAAELAMGPLSRAVGGEDTHPTSEAWSALSRAVRNNGQPGLVW